MPVGSRKLLATMVSVVAAAAVLGVAAWMLTGNSGDSPDAAAEVQIIPPVDAANAIASGGVDAPVIARYAETPAPVAIAVCVA